MIPAISGEECPVAILVTGHSDADRLGALARATGLEQVIAPHPRLLCRPPLVLWYSPRGLALQQTGKGVPGPVVVDFVTGKSARRRSAGGQQALARAVGVFTAGRTLSVLDATAGLGQDAFVLACLGCRVTLSERSAVIRALLRDGLDRAQQVPEVSLSAGLMSLLEAPIIDGEAGYTDQENSYDVVYLDPMFPATKRRAAPGKEMALLSRLLGPDDEADSLLEPALKLARHRVVVKRPSRAPDLAGRAPGWRLEGSSVRFDVYPLRGLRQS